MPAGSHLVLADGRLHYAHPEHEQFAVNAWRAPQRLFVAHTPNQRTILPSTFGRPPGSVIASANRRGNHGDASGSGSPLHNPNRVQQCRKTAGTARPARGARGSQADRDAGGVHDQLLTKDEIFGLQARPARELLSGDRKFT